MDDVDETLRRLTETLRIREAQLAALNPQIDVEQQQTPEQEKVQQ